jgi:hypothetical protein
MYFNWHFQLGGSVERQHVFSATRQVTAPDACEGDT